MYIYVVHVNVMYIPYLQGGGQVRLWVRYNINKGKQTILTKYIYLMAITIAFEPSYRTFSLVRSNPQEHVQFHTVVCD